VQKKAALRNATVPPVTPRNVTENSTDAAAAVAASLPPPRPCPMIPIHTNQPWFHGHISRDRAVALLAEHGPVDGLVSNSNYYYTNANVYSAVIMAQPLREFTRFI